MNETMRMEAKRLLEAEPEKYGSTHRCHKHWNAMFASRPQRLEDRPTDCSDCQKEFIAILAAGADANRFLVKWRNDAMRLLRAAFDLAAVEGKTNE